MTRTAALPLPSAEPGPEGPVGGRAPRVFVSYSQESPEHADRVLELVDRLRRDGVDAMVDQYVVSPPEGWPAWMDRQIDESDFVLLVCTETYFRRVMGREEAGKGLGVRWEGTLIYQHVFDDASSTARFIPVLFTPGSADNIPRPVKGASRYVVDNPEGYEALYRHVTSQPKAPPPPVAPRLRQWRREPGQADAFARVRKLPEVVVEAPDETAPPGTGPHLALARRHGRRRPVRSDLDLLNPFSRAIPLVGRDAEMSRLQAWLEGPAPVSAHCLVGPAGVGKTRLAIELCEWAEAREWQAGFVDAAELARFHRQQNLSDWGWTAPTLAVIDGAAAAGRALRPWLVELVYNPGAEGRPLRLLLLERHADRKLGWWSDLVTSRSFEEEGLADLFDPPEPRLLSSITDLEDRRRLAASAIAARAARPGGGRPAVTRAAPVSAGVAAAGISLGVEPLYLLMGAVTEDTSANAGGRTALARQLARFELGRIEALAADRQLKGEFVSHMAGFVTLAGGLRAERLVDVIAAEQAALRWQGAGDPPEIAAALRDALGEPGRGGGDVVPAVLPELVGEAVVLAALEKQPAETQAAVIRRARAIGRRACVATVVRTAQDHADREDHPSLQWLDALIDAAEGVPELLAISDQLPDRTIRMIERALLVEERLVQAQRDLPGGDGEEPDPDLARHLTRYASRLRDVCHFENALAVAEEAVATYRAFTGRAAWSRAAGTGISAAWSASDGLPEALLALGGIACDLGRREDAFAASAEAVSLLRGAVDAVSRRRRALALSVAASHLSDLGRRDEALAAAEEAIALHRELAASCPETDGPPLALALLNLAYCLSDLGRGDEAVAAAEESVALFAPLARAKPDAYLPGYAQALHGLAVYLGRIERLPDALDQAREAVGIQRSMAEGCPEAYLPDLARMLNGYANALRQSGDTAGALDAIAEAVGLLRALAAARPQAHRAELAKQLNNHSILLASSGEIERAIETGREAVQILREAAATRPDRHDEDLATALLCLAFCHHGNGAFSEMVDCAAESVAIRRRLAERWPEAFRSHLARALQMQIEALKLAGREAEAETVAGEAASMQDP